jgi:hypothetical protein
MIFTASVWIILDILSYNMRTLDGANLLTVALCCRACISSCMEGLQGFKTWGQAVQEGIMTLKVKIL